MKPAAFEYHAPTTAEQAVALLAELGDEAKPIAGGQSLIPLLSLRLTAFDHLVDVGRVAELHGIEHRDGSLWIGAGTTQADIGRSAEVAAAVPMLSRATPLIGHFQIRNRGTLGGSVAHADAAGEYPAVVLALDATIETLSPRGARTIPAADFFTDRWSTALADDELLTGIAFPVRRPWTGHAIAEFSRRPGDFALAGAAVSVSLDASGAVTRCAIGLLGLGPCVQRAATAEQAVLGCRAADCDPEAIGRTAVTGLGSVPADLHGSADYRIHLGAAMVASALTDALREAQG